MLTVGELLCMRRGSFAADGAPELAGAPPSASSRVRALPSFERVDADRSGDIDVVGAEVVGLRSSRFASIGLDLRAER
jgi:hypothetical protein